MPYYPFISADGSEEPRDFYMEYEDAVDIGATVEIEGRKWTRLVSPHQALVKNFKPFVCSQQGAFASQQEAEASGIVADKWVPDPESGELRAGYFCEETARKNAAASKDKGDRHLTWDD